MNKNKRYFLVIFYLLTFNAITNANKDDDWTTADLIKYGGMAAVGGISAVIATPFVLAAAGFTATGIAAGSLAAVTQAGVGNIVGGSVFAALQSAGVAGLGGTVSACLATAGAATGAAVARVFDRKTDKDD